MDVVQPACTPSQIEWSFHDLSILLLVSDLPTVRQFILRHTQVKRVMFGSLGDTDVVMDSDTESDADTEDAQMKKNVIDIMKVLKCYSEIAN